VLQEDKDFIDWWEKNRSKEISWNHIFTKGLGMGLMLSFPIVLAVLFRGWYKRMPFVSGGQLLLILIGCLLVSVFYAFFKGRMEWEAKESRYRQLKQKL
jgi:hypothetical protein